MASFPQANLNESVYGVLHYFDAANNQLVIYQATYGRASNSQILIEINGALLNYANGSWSTPTPFSHNYTYSTTRDLGSNGQVALSGINNYLLSNTPSGLYFTAVVTGTVYTLIESVAFPVTLGLGTISFGNPTRRELVYSAHQPNLNGLVALIGYEANDYNGGGTLDNSAVYSNGTYFRDSTGAFISNPTYNNRIDDATLSLTMGSIPGNRNTPYQAFTLEVDWHGAKGYWIIWGDGDTSGHPTIATYDTGQADPNPLVGPQYPSNPTVATTINPGDYLDFFIGDQGYAVTMISSRYVFVQHSLSAQLVKGNIDVAGFDGIHAYTLYDCLTGLSYEVHAPVGMHFQEYNTGIGCVSVNTPEGVGYITVQIYVPPIYNYGVIQVDCTVDPPRFETDTGPYSENPGAPSFPLASLTNGGMWARVESINGNANHMQAGTWFGMPTHDLSFIREDGSALVPDSNWYATNAYGDSVETIVIMGALLAGGYLHVFVYEQQPEVLNTSAPSYSVTPGTIHVNRFGVNGGYVTSTTPISAKSWVCTTDLQPLNANPLSGVFFPFNIAESIDNPSYYYGYLPDTGDTTTHANPRFYMGSDGNIYLFGSSAGAAGQGGFHSVAVLAGTAVQVGAWCIGGFTFPSSGPLDF